MFRILKRQSSPLKRGQQVSRVPRNARYRNENKPAKGNKLCRLRAEVLGHSATLATHPSWSLLATATEACSGPHPRTFEGAGRAAGEAACRLGASKAKDCFLGVNGNEEAIM